MIYIMILNINSFMNNIYIYLIYFSIYNIKIYILLFDILYKFFDLCISYFIFYGLTLHNTLILIN
jgi:hypothetical protein